MNKTVTINLSGTVFHIDENAYEVLRRYLDELRQHFATTQGREEIIADIESRMAEMFSEKVSDSKNVIMMDDVKAVIDVMGRPEQVAGDEKSEQDGASKSAYNEDSYYESARKRLFRNPEDKILGGVCSGISAYFNMDPIWLRLIFALSFIFAGSGLLVYIILWIIIPEAKTAADKLQMHGEKVNIKNIEKSVREEMEALRQRGESFAKDLRSEAGQERLRSRAGKAGNFFIDLIKGFIRFFAIIFGIIITIMSLAALVVLTIAIFSGIGVANFMIPHPILGMVLSHSQIAWLIIGGLLAVGIPFTLLLLNGLKLIFKVKLNLKSIGLVMAGFWLVGIGICVLVALNIVSGYQRESTISRTKMISTTQSSHIVLKADRHWALNLNDTHFEIGDLDDLIITNAKGDSVICPFVRLTVAPSDNDSVYLVSDFNSCGSNYEQAHTLATTVNYRYAVNDSVITLPNYFVLNPHEKYRGQNVKLTLKLPRGKTVHFDKSLDWMLHDVPNVTDTWDDDMLGHSWMMTESGLTCLDCPADKDSDDDHDEDSGTNVRIHNGKVTIEKNGKHIEINGHLDTDSSSSNQ